jgi:cell wall-associated NlpC family hydrolase
VFERATGMALPRNAAAISRLGDRVERSELQPGDLVFFVIRRALISHVGMYVGDGRFVHAASRGGDVRVSHLEERYWSRRFAQARRLLSTP